jgi:general stress protein 26
MSTEKVNTQAENNQKINELIKDIRIAMLTTMDTDGQLHSRPMGNMEKEFDGTAWFFTKKDSPKIHAIESDSHVNLAYSNPKQQAYISMAGKATVVADKEKMKELWSPFVRAWFPEGLEDPSLILISVEIESAQYWESPSSTVVKIVGFTKALLTGKAYKAGETKKIQVQH